METTQIILTIILLIVELVAFAWLILDIQKSKKKQDKILDLERQILEMEKSIMEIENNIILEIADEQDSSEPPFAPSKKSNKPVEFTLKGKHDTAKYTLDSCILRDIDKHHFGSTLTCNKKQFGFDGISFGRLNPFSWKKLINVDKNWTFQGSDTEWNFRNGSAS